MFGGTLGVCVGGGGWPTHQKQANWAFTRSDRRTDRSVRTQATSDCLSDQSDRPVGQTVAEPPTSVNQINVAC